MPSNKYAQDFLDSVIVRIDFDTTLPFSIKAPPTVIYEQTKERFPITEEKHIIGKEFIVGPKQTTQRETENLEWHYYGKNREKVLKIGPTFLLIEYNKYEYYEQLREDFLAVTNLLFDTFPKVHGKRLGFRYIDNIEMDEPEPTSWDKYINPDLNRNLSIVTDTKTLSRIFHVMEYNYGESNLRFQYGMLNPDYPAPIKKKRYTLDFDMYTNNIIEKHEIDDLLDSFHDKLINAFEEVVTEDLRQIMGIKE